jgi:cytochrome c peroxidase
VRGLAFALLLCAAPAAAQVAEPVAGLDESRWLARDALADQLSSRPVEVLRSERAGGRASLQVELGRLAFRSPQALGGTARREELACESCHAGGHVNAGFFVLGLSSRPGTVDVTHALFNPWRDDGLANPLEIPSLRGAAKKERYGHEGRFASLREFIRHVMVDEFAADEPPPWLLDALAAYVTELMPTAAADQPVTLAADLADLERFLDVVEAAAAEGDEGKTDFVAGALRFQLGRLHQRFAPPGGEAAQAVLVAWSRALAASRNPKDIAALRRRIAPERRVLTEAEPGSLYDPAVLRQALGG